MAQVIQSCPRTLAVVSSISTWCVELHPELRLLVNLYENIILMNNVIQNVLQKLFLK